MTSKKILLVGSNWIHPPLLGRLALGNLLRRQPNIHVERAPSINALPRHNLAAVNALVLYYHQQHISPDALHTLDSYIAEGGSLLALHAASASFKQEPRYFDILGGRFVGHGAVTTYRVEPVRMGTCLPASISGFNVRDELYRHELAADVDVLFIAPVGERQEPVVWVRCHGLGKVGYCALGHTVSAMRQPEVHALLLALLDWALQKDQTA